EAAELDRRFEEGGFSDYSREIFPEIADHAGPPAGPTIDRPAGLDPRLLHLVGEQLSFIERAVFELRLGEPRNRDGASYRGLMNLFRRWSQSDSFRQAWLVSIGTHGPDLERFCDEALELRPKVTWQRIDASKLNDFERKYANDYNPRYIYAC